VSEGNTENNSYLDQVVANQEVLEANLRGLSRSTVHRERLRAEAKKESAAVASKPAPPPMPAQAGGMAAGGGGGPGHAVTAFSGPSGAPPQSQSIAPDHAAQNGVEVRITGVGRWKTVLVPPNAFVVHTRRGEAEPRHVGLGVSFRYNPATDSFLVVPGAMQTILLNAYCICSELQGILVQAYVQWIIQDFSTAYRKLDFSDPVDPMNLVNLQLKEQAEAAIKDKVATMGVHEVLSDRQPIIEELTARLRAVAEGEGESGNGLGLRIVTVQIKEAVVSSSRLWQNLQKPFRSEQERLAALAELATEGAVSESRMAEARRQETRRLADERELSDLRSANAARDFDREAGERARRGQWEQKNAREAADARNATELHALNLERERHAQEGEMARLRIEQQQELARLALQAELETARARTEAEHERVLLELERERLRAEIANGRSAASIQAELIGSLPAIVEAMPTPNELRSVTIGGRDASSLAGLVAELSAVVQALRSTI
jgi:hypothetical protein